MDHAFASSTWCQPFPLCKLQVFHTIYSDHDLFHIDFLNTDHSRRSFHFHFENVWLREESFHEEVARYWKALPPIHFDPKLLEFSTFMEN